MMCKNGREEIITVTVAGVLASLTLITGIGILVGYDLSETLARTSLLKRAHYILVLSSLGAGLAIAWQQDIQFTAIGGALAVISWIVISSPNSSPLTNLNIGLTLFAILLVLMASLEYGLQNLKDIRHMLTRQTIIIGFLGGSLHAGIVLIVWPWLGFSTAYFQNLVRFAMTIWMLGGTFIIGMTVMVSLERYRLGTPLLTVIGLFSWVIYKTWGYREILRGGQSGLAGTQLTLYLWGWFAVLGLALGIGLIEHRFRKRIGEQSIKRGIL